MSEKMDFADGKYTVINDNGKLTALRHGEPWGRDLVGDNLVYWMLVDSLQLKAQRNALLAALKEIDSWLVCSCIATAEDMAQSFPHMQQVASAAIKAVEGENT